MTQKLDLVFKNQEITRRIHGEEDSFEDWQRWVGEEKITWLELGSHVKRIKFYFWNKDVRWSYFSWVRSELWLVEATKVLPITTICIRWRVGLVEVEMFM